MVVILHGETLDEGDVLIVGQGRPLQDHGRVAAPLLTPVERGRFINLPRVVDPVGTD